MLGTFYDNLAPIGATIISGYILSPYPSMTVRHYYPQAYEYITGRAIEDLGILEYRGIYLQSQEGLINFAYDNRHAIGASIGLVGYFTAKFTYSFIMKPLTTSLLKKCGFFAKNNAPEEEERQELADQLRETADRLAPPNN